MEDQQPPPWSNDYHFNINVQMIHYPLLAANRPQHLEPLWNLLRGLMPRLREIGARLFVEYGQTETSSSAAYSDVDAEDAVLAAGAAAAGPAGVRPIARASAPCQTPAPCRPILPPSVPSAPRRRRPRHRGGAAVRCGRLRRQAQRPAHQD
jgi:hypothetical protein